MRVLLLSHEYPPETAWGGIGTYAGTLAPALVALGAEVHVVASGHVRRRSTTVREGVHVHRLPLVLPSLAGRAARMPETWQRISLAATAAREVRRIGVRFDVCEAPDWGAEAALIHALPLVVRLHSGAAQILPYVGPAGVDRRTAIRLEHRVVRRADLVTGTRVQIEYARDVLGIAAERLVALTLPVRPIDAGEAPGEPVVLFVGRLEERKGPATVIEAMPGLLERVPDARLVVAGADTMTLGGGSYRARLDELVARLELGSCVEFADAPGAEAVRERLQQARVVAVPSRWESFGYVAAEAMAAGRAVVASDLPALRDLVRDGVTGRLVPAAEPAAWAAALAELLEDAEAAERLAVAARADVSERFAPATVAAATLAVYERSIAARA